MHADRKLESKQPGRQVQGLAFSPPTVGTTPMSEPVAGSAGDTEGGCHTKNSSHGTVDSEVLVGSSRLILRHSERYCRRLARSHYENFLVASILLPRRLRQPFYNIYTFCRTADDIADESGDRRLAREGLDRIAADLEDVFAGKPRTEGMFPALHHTIATFAMDRKPFFDLLSAFRQDQEVLEYETLDQLLDYCSRSANPVGRLVLKLAGVTDAEQIRLSDQICTGLQLANFWQDVGRDYAIGRVYLPDQWRQRYGVTRDMLSAGATSEPVRRLLADLCKMTDGYFQRGIVLAEKVPDWLSADIKLFAHGGMETLAAIRRVDFDVLRKRPKVSKLTQGKLILAALLGRLS
ncbi:squalene synthase HpnC [Roseiconus lacunae]|uniref:squalene synthase HpnC n=1 Tax=Roseiconus lacunae TaxID=2605694 RepID=UPI001E429D28|nr:squalene synthase HpnC [Roseiconus lacunae]MCD0458334.1 squalene synthase HpnC [Roseiconus lacunae]